MVSAGREGGAILVMGAQGEVIPVMGAFGGPLRRTARSACPGSYGHMCMDMWYLRFVGLFVHATYPL